MAVVAPLLVNPPTLTPPRFGLLSVATLVDDPDLHWANGIEYSTSPDPSASAEAVEVKCEPGEAADLDDEPLATVVDGALRVHTGAECKLPGTTREEVAAYVRGALAGGEGPALERAIWHDAETPIMSADTALPAGDEAVSLYTGLGALEAWLYETYGGTGVLHVARAAIPFLQKAHQIKVDGGKLHTVLGTPVSAGAYPGSGPDKAAPDEGELWIAATAAVQYRRGPVTTRDTFNHRTNAVTVIAERLYLPSWEHLAGATLITLEA